MFRYFVPIIMIAFVNQAFAEDACTRVCNDAKVCTLSCKAKSFQVGLPDGWTNDESSVKRLRNEGEFVIDAHLISGRVPETGANCPIASHVSVDPKGVREFVAQGALGNNAIVFWSEIFRRAGLILEERKILKKTKWDDKARSFSDEPGFDNAWNKEHSWVLVEITFRIKEGGALFRARQAMYFLKRSSFSAGEGTKTSSDVSHHTPDRLYFVNCTALASSSAGTMKPDGSAEVVDDPRDLLCEKRPFSAVHEDHTIEPFCKEKVNIDAILKSFSPLACVESKGGAEQICAPQVQALETRDWENVSSARPMSWEEIVGVTAALSASAAQVQNTTPLKR